jgi:hypothetical protein
MRTSGRFNRVLAGGLIAAAVGFPATTQARPAVDPPASAPAVEQVGSGGGFQWDDAGVGAAGAALLLGAGTALAGGARRRRTQRPAVG